MPGLKEILGSIFGGKNPIDSLKDLVGEFHASPEDKAKLIELLNAKQDQWRQFESKMIEADVANTNAARDMNAKIQGAAPTWLAKNVAYLIDIFVAVIWGAFTFYLAGRAFKLIDTDQHVDLTAILGIYAAVSTQFGIVINFHRGSSQGSVDKQKMIDKLTS